MVAGAIILAGAAVIIGVPLFISWAIEKLKQQDRRDA